MYSTVDQATKALREVATDLTALSLSEPDTSALRSKLAVLAAKTDEARCTLAAQIVRANDQRTTPADRANEDVRRWRESCGPEAAAQLAHWYEAQATKHL